MRGVRILTGVPRDVRRARASSWKRTAEQFECDVTGCRDGRIVDSQNGRDGLRLSHRKQFGLRVIPLRPGLVPLSF